MRNTRQGPLGSEGNNAPTIQQLMETVRALQEANEQYKREQEWIQREARAEQERLSIDAVTEALATAKAEQEKLMAEARAEHLLRQDQLMVEIDVSQVSSEELRKTNEELRKNLQQLDECSTVERGPIALLRARPKPFS